MTQANAVVLLSGGLDSSTVLAMAQQQNFNCYALSFHYGQRSHAELTAAKRVAETDKSVAYCKPLVKDGAAIVGSDDALPDWLLDVMVTDSDAKRALDHVLSVAKALDVPRFVR